MDDAYPTEREEARALVESCTACALLAADIRALAASVSALPRPVRTRDFTITAAQAEQLHGSRLTRWLRSLGTPGWAALRPVAGVALSIGLVMAVVGSALPPTQSPETFQTVGAPAADQPATVPQPAPTVAQDVTVPPQNGPGRGGMELSAAPTHDPVTERVDTAYVQPSAEPGTDDGLEKASVQATADPTRGLLVYAGLAIATLSFGLLALAWVARRYFADPLLR
jgi:hypothetical protein